MEFQPFKKILDLQVKHSQNRHYLYKLGVDLMEYDESSEKTVSLLWAEILTEQGIYDLEYFLYDKDYISGKLKEEMKVFDGGKEIMKDLKGLYDYLIDNKYFKI